ncbi:MAG: nucleotidyltransferase family protein [Deltaproteobacteria bacterium]|nr:nucleotidyltransferase family protein [Deltaproteobacteria bacterium]
MPDHAIEQKILACVSKADLEAYDMERVGTLLASAPDLDLLVRKAAREGLSSMLYGALERSGTLGLLGRDHRQALESGYYQTLSFNIALLHDLKEILEGLNKRGVSVVLLQGIGLIQWVYKDIGLRPMTDIDLWVLPWRYPSLKRILSSHGYQPDSLYPNTYRRGMTAFDIHTHILWADRIRSRKLLLDVDDGEIYRKTVHVKVEGQDALCLSPWDEVIYLGLHAIKHNMDRLIWLADIRNIIEPWSPSDWHGAMSRAKQLGQTRTLHYVLFLLKDIFDVRAPRGVVQDLGKSPLHPVEKKILRHRTRGEPIPRWSSLLLLSAGKGLRVRLLLLLENLFPRPDILKQVFPWKKNQGLWRLYLRRALQIARWGKNALLHIF